MAVCPTPWDGWPRRDSQPGCSSQFFAAFGFFFTILQYLQYVTERSPFEAALALLPLPFILIPVARNAPHVADRIGFRRVGPVGLALMAAAFALFSQLDASTPYWYFVVGLALFGVGMGLAGTPATTAITSALPPAKQGVASALNDTARELGSAFGIAILGSLLNQGYRDGMADAVAALPPAIAERVLASVAFTGSPEMAQLGAAGEALVARARDAFVGGVGDALLVGAVALVVAAVAVAVLAPRRSHRPSEAGVAPSEPRVEGAAGR